MVRLGPTSRSASLNDVVRQAGPRPGLFSRWLTAGRAAGAMFSGVDFAWGGGSPSGAQVESAGYHFGVSYLSTDGTKCWTAGQVADFHAHGAGVCAVVEDGAGMLLGSAAAGRSRALAAVAQAKSLGWPGGRPLYWACDTDTDWTSITLYMQGVRSVLAKNETGLYGGINPILGAQASGLVGYFWQTLAWSSGRVASGIHLYQNGNTTTVGGQSCDVNAAYALDYGQWYGVAPVPVPTPPPVADRRRLDEEVH